jgi:hypothetical protein
MRCVIHPGLAQATTVAGKPYCKECQAQMATAVGHLDPHVSPRECFVWYTGGAKGWAPIDGTGCAHFVSHELGIHRGHAGEQCLAGSTFRVSTMLRGRTKVTGGLTAVKSRDIWANGERTHCGLVVRVGPDVVTGASGEYPAIWIRHSSSRLHRVSLDRFDAYFRSEGEFFR